MSVWGFDWEYCIRFLYTKYIILACRVGHDRMRGRSVRGSSGEGIFYFALRKLPHCPGALLPRCTKVLHFTVKGLGKSGDTPDSCRPRSMFDHATPCISIYRFCFYITSTSKGVIAGNRDQRPCIVQ